MTRRMLARALAATGATLIATSAVAQPAKIDAADTAWMITATAIVLMMTIPGLALFYAGMVRKKNVLATMAQSLAATFLISIVWAVIGYTLAFTGEGAFLGPLDRFPRTRERVKRFFVATPRLPDAGSAPPALVEGALGRAANEVYAELKREIARRDGEPPQAA